VGGGFWVQVLHGAAVINETQNPGGVVALTAGAGSQALVLSAGMQWNDNSVFRGLSGVARIEARVMVTCGGVAGSVVTLALEGDAYAVGPTYAPLDTKAITLLADQSAQMTLVGHLAIDNNFWAYRVLGAAVAQDASVEVTAVDVLVTADSLGAVP
jgi:hypothetical protein